MTSPSASLASPAADPAAPSSTSSDAGTAAHPSTSAHGELADLRRRLLGLRPTDVLWGWLGPLLVTAFAGVLRFWHLGQPHQLIFDETYYVKQAFTYLVTGYELAWPEGADESFTRGTTDVYLDRADFPVHPPVGKWMLALGQWVFGSDSSFGWRFGAALAGTLSVLMVARIGRRLLGSTLLGTVAGLLLAVDGEHLVMSRTGILDIFVMFWVVAAFGALLLDRDASRARLAVVAARERATRPRGAGLPGLGPWLLARPWRGVAAVCLGLAIGSKWSGLYVFAAFGLMSVLWDAGARRTVGVRHWFTGAVLKDGLPAAAGMLLLAGGTYLATWTGWFVSSDAHQRQYAAEDPSYLPWLPDSLASLWKYHEDMYEFHVNLHTSHPYQSSAWSWLVQGRPTSFFYESPSRGVDGCTVETCSKAITALGNPVVWWGGSLALLVLLVTWALRRDWRAGAVLAGVAGTYLPWFLYPERTIYTFYTVVMSPFMALALAMALGMLVGPQPGPAADGRVGTTGRTVRVALAGTVVVAAVGALVFFWPVWTGQVIPVSHWRWRMWFPSWI